MHIRTYFFLPTAPYSYMKTYRTFPSIVLGNLEPFPSIGLAYPQTHPQPPLLTALTHSQLSPTVPPYSQLPPTAPLPTAPTHSPPYSQLPPTVSRYSQLPPTIPPTHGSHPQSPPPPTHDSHPQPPLLTAPIHNPPLLTASTHSPPYLGGPLLGEEVEMLCSGRALLLLRGQLRGLQELRSELPDLRHGHLDLLHLLLASSAGENEDSRSGSPSHTSMQVHG